MTLCNHLLGLNDFMEKLLLKGIFKLEAKPVLAQLCRQN